MASALTTTLGKPTSSWKPWDAYVGGPESGQLVTLLRQYARAGSSRCRPLLSPAERETLGLYERGDPGRMLRLAEALEVLTAIRPLVLVVEDLHWVILDARLLPPMWHVGVTGRAYWSWAPTDP